MNDVRVPARWVSPHPKTLNRGSLPSKGILGEARGLTFSFQLPTVADAPFVDAFSRTPFIAYVSAFQYVVNSESNINQGIKSALKNLETQEKPCNLISKNFSDDR